MAKLSNKGKGIAFAVLSIFMYSIPLLILALVNLDRLVKTPETALTTFSIIVLLFFFFFAKKVVKGFCKVLTPLGFGSIVVFFIALALNNILADLVTISIYSLIGSVLAWVPYQISVVFVENSVEVNGKKPENMTIRQACTKMLGQSLLDN